MKKIVIILLIFVLFFIIGCNKINPMRFGNNCRIERTCGSMVGIDCQSNADGPYYYVDKNSGDIISTCGGACMSGRCTNCPPAEWNCETY